MSSPEGSHPLYYLPAELFEKILTYLDLDSVKAFRLTNRKLADRCIGPRFLASIPQPVLDASSHKLRSLHALACNPVLRKKIHSVTFQATIVDASPLKKNLKAKGYIEQLHIFGHKYKSVKVKYTREELAKVKSDLKKLKEDQKARATESADEIIDLLRLVFQEFGELGAIHLDGAVPRGRMKRETPEDGEWYSLWTRAWHIFTWIMTAFMQSGASVKKFDLFNTTRRCCIPNGKLASYASRLDSTQREMLTKGLQSLELSMSGEIQDNFDVTEESDREDGLNEEGEKATSVRAPHASTGHLFLGDDPRGALAHGTPGVTSLFLKSALALRELDLTFRRTVESGSEFKKSYDRIIDNIAHEAQLPMLEKCAFSGFPAKGESILLFLQKHSDLRSFKVHGCRLTTGSWTPIFSYLEQSMPKLENLDLSDLFGKHMQNHKYAQRRMTGYFNSDDNIEQEAEDDEEEGNGLVVLLPIWDTAPEDREKEFLCTNGRSVHTRSFTGEDIKKGLVFRPLHRGPGRPLASPTVNRWNVSHSKLYGPPTSVKAWL
ncbi:uncharacterized protein BO80DRAFT_495496 [Aspergillus ibericus CBS 121593]|uniref:F-box domain-containing protein n=1 Tax=Aspergillus ibericus CBS 121593 TaxID=1448316 RepID=A0A395GSS4_9EURO|nr:hypothetical protein BO80DRAFT_495496 [Aspergillus ibericus CBS 121593]RAK98466.1 hypothetical protein BO80DRAFT_495496 [Aspergillus ibericus CBS 121593]